MKTICVPVGCRSDAGLSAPIIKRLRESGWCEVQVVQLEPQEFIPSYQIAEYYCRGEPHIGNHNHKKPDLLFITGDRVEQCAAANAAFLNQIPIAHYYGGIINLPITTYDDVFRHTITMLSNIQFVESNEAAGVVWDLKHAVGLKSNIHVVGISHLDDMALDESLVPKTKYTLILYNPPTTISNDIYDIYSQSCIYNDYTILIGSNPDGKTNAYLEEMVDIYYPNLPRAQFLGLLKNCHRFISNSSCCIYEAPHFLNPEQIIMIGDRNKNRPRGPFKTGASDKIVTILKEYLCGENQK